MNEQILLKNDDLLNIIKVLKTNYSKQVEEELYRQMQKSKLLLPAIIREENKISIVKIIDEKENEYLPVFTDWTNFQLYLDSTKEFQPIVFTFNEYFNILVADLNLSGIVINPYSHNLVLSRKISSKYPKRGTNFYRIA